MDYIVHKQFTNAGYTLGDTLAKGTWQMTERVVDSALNALYIQVSRKYDLEVAEWHVLVALYQQDGQRPSDLAKAIARPVTSFTPTLDHLERKGFIQRRSHAGDRRSVRITLTDQARHLQAEVQQGETVVREILAQRFSPQDYQTLLRLLGDFAAS